MMFLMFNMKGNMKIVFIFFLFLIDIECMNNLILKIEL